VDTPEYDRVLARACFAALQQRYIDDCMHYLTDRDVFDTKTALYDDRTAPGDEQDGGANDGIYPRTSIGPRGEVVLEPCALECVHQPSTKVNFLDYAIEILNGRIITDVHDKRKKMDVYANSWTFPHRESLVSNKVRYNILTSQFIRFGRRCSRFCDFLRNAVTLTANMLRHGYNRRLIQNKIWTSVVIGAATASI
jgi:hypothetical protein